MGGHRDGRGPTLDVLAHRDPRHADLRQADPDHVRARGGTDPGWGPDRGGQRHAHRLGGRVAGRPADPGRSIRAGGLAQRHGGPIDPVAAGLPAHDRGRDSPPRVRRRGAQRPDRQRDPDPGRPAVERQPARLGRPLHVDDPGGHASRQRLRPGPPAPGQLRLVPPDLPGHRRNGGQRLPGRRRPRVAAGPHLASGPLRPLGPAGRIDERALRADHPIQGRPGRGSRAQRRRGICRADQPGRGPDQGCPEQRPGPGPLRARGRRGAVTAAVRYPPAVALRAGSGAVSDGRRGDAPPVRLRHRRDRAPQPGPRGRPLPAPGGR